MSSNEQTTTQVGDAAERPVPAVDGPEPGSAHGLGGTR